MAANWLIVIIAWTPPARQSRGDILIVLRELADEHVAEAEAALREQEGWQVAAEHGQETRAQLQRLL